ncbi:DUF1090 domain-containing protein [Ottowia thiooxydans]|uniref:DUF1090 domain-containing protein n=1 Tax=Ottowia thiooxydans TaxID=219182 RepID=UPI0003F94EBB|nr:DUF1090 domain-containing protein [Ottowia thiooxydans]
MKRILFLALLIGSAAAPAMAAEPSAACAAKRANIEAQLQEATARGRKQEIAGLQKALKANKARCTDELLAKEREKDIKQAQKKLAERERDLSAAQLKGDAKKIEERQRKLDEARSQLEAAQKPIGS